jgi:hypothetical protein
MHNKGHLAQVIRQLPAGFRAIFEGLFRHLINFSLFPCSIFSAGRRKSRDGGI